jgi:hypothetical protein
VGEDQHVRNRSIVVALVAVILAVGGIACGDDDEDSATTTAADTSTMASTASSGPVSSASDASCAARDELETAISDLSNVDVVRDGTSSVTDALTGINDALGEVRSTAGDDVQPEVEAFQQALDELQTAIGGGTSQPAAIATGVRDVASSGAALLTSMRNLHCP